MTEFIDSNASLRNAYIDRSRLAAIDALQQHEVVAELGSIAISLAKVLDKAEITNVDHKVIKVPHGVNNNALMLTALYPGEIAYTDQTLNTQTETQRELTVKKFEEWQPRGATARRAYDYLISDSNDQDSQPVSLEGTHAVAMTGSLHAVFGGKKDLADKFINAPKKGIVMVAMRPQMILQIKPNFSVEPPDVISHESVHAAQFMAAPIDILYSQSQVNKVRLRNELQAYHVGASVTRAIAPEYRNPTMDLHMEGYREVQVVVDAVRQTCVGQTADQYNPNGRIVDIIDGLGLGNIIHGVIDYQTTLNAVNNF